MLRADSAFAIVWEVMDDKLERQINRITKKKV